MDKPTSTCATLCSKRTHDRPSTCAAHAHRARRGSLREYGRASRGGGQAGRVGRVGRTTSALRLCSSCSLRSCCSLSLSRCCCCCCCPFLPVSLAHAPRTHTHNLSLSPPHSLSVSLRLWARQQGASEARASGKSQWQELSMIACAQRAWAAGGQPPQVCSSYCRSAPTAGLLLRY